MHATVVGTFLSPRHTFSKSAAAQLVLLEGLGIEGDAHCGRTVRHRSRVAKDPLAPNLRQVHLLQEELFEELASAGFRVGPGDLGENLTTRGVDLLALPRDTLLHIGAAVLVRITGLRNPCRQIDAFQSGLLQAVVDRDAEGQVVRKAGVMGVVLRGGVVRTGDAVRVERPQGAQWPLQPV